MHNLCKTVYLSAKYEVSTCYRTYYQIYGFLIFKAKRSHSRDGPEKYRRERHEEDKRATKALADLRER